MHYLKLGLYGAIYWNNGNYLNRVYTQFIFEWPILTDRFWVLVYILKKIVSNSLFFSKNNIQRVQFPEQFFYKTMSHAIARKFSKEYTLNSLLISIKPSLKFQLCHKITSTDEDVNFRNGFLLRLLLLVSKSQLSYKQKLLGTEGYE